MHDCITGINFQGTIKRCYRLFISFQFNQYQSFFCMDAGTGITDINAPVKCCNSIILFFQDRKCESFLKKNLSIIGSEVKK